MSYRYRFIERYGLVEDSAHPEVVAQYHVAMRDTMRSELERPGGAPDRKELTTQTIYTERPARVGKLGEVTDAVRRYELFRVLVAAPREEVAPNPSLFRDHLTVWYHLRPGRLPEVLSLVPGRSLVQDEFGLITNGAQLIMPSLYVLLPRTPARVGDSWRIPRSAGQALLGEPASGADYELDGRLVEVRPNPGGTTLTAVIEIKGEMELDDAPAAVSARILFEFTRAAAAPATPASGAAPKEAGRRGGTTSERERGIVDARGWISEVRMGRTHSIPIDKDGRLRHNRTRQLVLQRRRSMGAPGTGPAFPELVVPEKPPTPDSTNSWLLYDDILRQNHFRHPQEFEPNPPDPRDPMSLELVYERPDGKKDVIRIMSVPKTLDPTLYRKLSDPLSFVRQLNDIWSQKGYRMVQGPAGWLPETDWAPLKRKVYRYEAAIKPDLEANEEPQGARIYLDAYLVQFNRGDCIIVQALTNRNDHVVLRDQTEALIRTLDLGPSTPGVGAAPAPPGTTGPGAPAQSGAPAPAGTAIMPQGRRP